MTAKGIYAENWRNKRMVRERWLPYLSTYTEGTDSTGTFRNSSLRCKRQEMDFEKLTSSLLF